MSFREVPNKRRLVLLVPPDLYKRVRQESHETERSLSEIGSEAIARGFGMEPTWQATTSPEPIATG